MKSIQILALALLLMGCGGLVGEPKSTEARLAAMVERYNEVQASAKTDDQSGAQRHARIEGGNTLVIEITNVPTGNSTFDPNAMRKSLRPEICDDLMRELLDAGISVRFDLTSNFGKKQPSVHFSRC